MHLFSTQTHFVLDSTLNTGNNAIVVLMDSNYETVLDSGDEIGIFTPPPASVLCGAAKYHQGENLAITVWGDDAGAERAFSKEWSMARPITSGCGILRH